jgi:hypothetical protein
MREASHADQKRKKKKKIVGEGSERQSISGGRKQNFSGFEGSHAVPIRLSDRSTFDVAHSFRK